MKVLVGGRIYDSEKTPILVIFEEQEQDLVNGMKRLISFPKGSKEKEMEELRDTDLDALYLASKKVGDTVKLKFNSCFRQGRIEHIETLPATKKVIFHLISPFGNTFQLTLEEMQYHEVSR